MQKTSISIGEAINDLLSSDKTLVSAVTKIFPVVTDKADLPYVAYRRVKTEQISVKGYRTGCETVTVQVNSYAASYEKSIAIAEMVRQILDGVQYDKNGIFIRSSVLSSSEETWENDAFVQKLIFEFKV